MTWKPRYLKDHFDAGRHGHRIAAHSDVGNHAVKCDTCGRTTAADMALDVSVLPAAIRQQIKLESGDDFACDACVERWISERRITRSQLWRSLGAPAETMARIRNISIRKGEPTDAPA